MSNDSPMCGVVAGSPAAGAQQCTDHWSAEIQRKRDALRSKLAILEEARRRLEEIQHDAGAGAADESYSDTAGGDDDFYPLDDDGGGGDEPPAEERRRPTMQWQDQVCRQMVDNHNDDDLVGYRSADSDDNHDLDLDGDGDDEISRDIVALGLHVPHIQPHAAAGTAATPPPPSVGGARGHHARRRGFGAVPASAAAIASLGRHRYEYDGSSSSGGGTCVICMKDYKKGRRLRVVPCAYKHRFHGRCIREWLSWSNLCPLCRHALPAAAADVAAEQGGGGGGGGVRRSTVVRLNVNPY